MVHPLIFSGPSSCSKNDSWCTFWAKRWCCSSCLGGAWEGKLLLLFGHCDFLTLLFHDKLFIMKYSISTDSCSCNTHVDYLFNLPHWLLRHSSFVTALIWKARCIVLCSYLDLINLRCTLSLWVSSWIVQIILEAGINNVWVVWRSRDISTQPLTNFCAEIRSGRKTSLSPTGDHILASTTCQ